jgi:hypothetical protein
MESYENNIHPDDRPRVFQGLSRVIEQGHLMHEYRFRHKEGAYRWIQDHATGAGDRGAPMELVGCWLDVTERKEAEMELHSGKRSSSRRKRWQPRKLTWISRKTRRFGPTSLPNLWRIKQTATQLRRISCYDILQAERMRAN